MFSLKIKDTKLLSYLCGDFKNINMAKSKIYMLQRVQTLYILSAFFLTVSLFFDKVMSVGNVEVKFIEYRPFLILTIVSVAVGVLTFMVFTSRVLQIRLCIFNMLILLAYQGWIIYAFINKEPNAMFSICSLFPIISAILYFIAMKYLYKDEALIQASNSLRSLSKKYKKKF